MKQSHKRRGPRVVVDTSAVISGISGFKSSFVAGKSDSADMLHEWLESGNFVWLVTPEIVDEYKEVAKRLRVRANVVRSIREFAQGGGRRSNPAGKR